MNQATTTMGREQPFDVLIVGGSFAGLALALALARTPASCLAVGIVERGHIALDEPAGDPRAFAISAGSKSLLDAIGVWPHVAREAEPVSGIDITDSALGDIMRPVLLSYDTIIAGDPQMLILPAGRLRHALLQEVLAEPGIRVVAPAAVAGIDTGPGWSECRLADGNSIAGRLIVAADGARSPVRSMIGIGGVGGSYAQRGIAAIVAHEREHEGRAVQHFLPAGPFALLPLPGRRSCITWSEGEADARRIMALDDAGFIAEAQKRAGWRLGALTLEGRRADWPLGVHLARRLVAPRLALIGDAARSVHPIAGQGVNLGFRDVAALAQSVVEGTRLGLDTGDATILERYERWRRLDGTQSAAAFTALNALFSNDVTALRTLRDAGLGLLDRLPGLKQMLVAEAAGRTGVVPCLLEGRPI
jgi:2-octaprenyl-6-methoxyphenol hydroxylase